MDFLRKKNLLNFRNDSESIKDDTALFKREKNTKMPMNLKACFMNETQSKDPKKWKICSKKILTVENEINSIKRKVQILNVPKNARNLLKDLNDKNFPNVFVILINFNGQIDKILGLTAQKFINRPLILQVKSLNFYIKRDIKFENVKLGSTETYKAENLLKTLSASLIDANFTQLNSLLSGINLSHGIYCLALSSYDLVLFRLLNLYNTNFSSELRADLLIFSIKSGYFDYFLAFFGVFDASQISDSKIKEMFPLKCNENAFLVAVKNRNFKVVNFFLNLYQTFPKDEDLI